MITIKIKTDNAAFDGDNLGIEVARILRRLADYLESYTVEEIISIRDINGNTVGSCKVTKRGPK